MVLAATTSTGVTVYVEPDYHCKLALTLLTSAKSVEKLSQPLYGFRTKLSINMFVGIDCMRTTTSTPYNLSLFHALSYMLLHRGISYHGILTYISLHHSHRLSDSPGKVLGYVVDK